MPTKVLFVCLGNICRSPTADAVFRQLVVDAGLQQRIQVDSAGTGDWHLGHPPDQRASAAAAARGYDLSALRARQVCAEDFLEFDHIIAMDADNLTDLRVMCPPAHRTKLTRLMEYAPEYDVLDVPDPYYGGGDGFERVLDMVEAASRALLDHLR